MRKKFKSLIALLLSLTMLLSTSATVFAQGVNDHKATNVKINQKEVQKLVDKILPFEELKDGKVVLTTDDAKAIGITKQELDDVKKGLEIANNSTIKVVDESTNSNNNSSNITPNISMGSDSYGLYIYLSSSDAKNLVATGYVAGFVSGLIIMYFVGETIIIAGLTVSKSCFTYVVTGALALGASLYWLYSDVQAATLYISKNTLYNWSGPILWYNGIHSASGYVN